MPNQELMQIIILIDFNSITTGSCDGQSEHMMNIFFDMRFLGDKKMLFVIYILMAVLLMRSIIFIISLAEY